MNNTHHNAASSDEFTKRKRTPSLYNIVSDLKRDNFREKSLEERIKESSIEDLSKLNKYEYLDLYQFGYVYIPRILLFIEEYIRLRAAAKAVYIWLIAKARIIEQKVKLGIYDDETRRFPAVTASNKEIAVYAGIKGHKNVPQYTAELENAGFIRKCINKATGKKFPSLYQLRPLTMDKSGYIRFPLKALVSVAYGQLSYEAKALYLIMVSESGSAKKDSEELFPEFKIAYSQIEKYGFSSATISNCIQELETYRFITAIHGKYNRELERNDMNIYALSTRFLDLF